jgi:hypothetical protein
MPLLGYSKEKPIFGTSNFWPMAAICIAALGTFWNFSAAQTKQESGLATVQKDQSKLEDAQKEFRLIMKEERAASKEELKAMNAKVDALYQLMITMQVQLVKIEQQKK